MTKALLRSTRLLRRYREKFSLGATTENPQLALLPLSRAAMVLPAVRSVGHRDHGNSLIFAFLSCVYIFPRWPRDEERQSCLNGVAHLFAPLAGLV